MNIIDRVKSLNLPFGEYVVVGGVMEVHGIRPAKDVDIVVTKKLYDILKKNGWKRKWFFKRVFTCKMLTKGEAEALSSYRYGNYNPTVEELIQRADIIEGVPFLPLEDLRKFKSQLAREKDLKDVELITNFLKSKI